MGLGTGGLSHPPTESSELRCSGVSGLTWAQPMGTGGSLPTVLQTYPVTLSSRCMRREDSPSHTHTLPHIPGSQ